MSPVSRIKDLPYPEKKWETMEDAQEYCRDLRNRLQEEQSERIEDFDILKLDNVPWVDVRTYGAKGDGTTDDSTAIQAAIDTGFRVKFSRNKTYSIATGLTVSTLDQIIEGCGRGTIIQASANIIMFTVQTNRHILFRDLTIDGDDTASVGIKGLIPKGYIQNCLVQKCNTAGVQLDDGAFSWRINDSSVSTNAGDGIQLSEGGDNNDIHILNNIISGNYFHGINITSGTPSYSDTIVIKDNDMENNCISGSSGTPCAHIYIGGGTEKVFIEHNHMESDISQAGYEKSRMVIVGAGCVNIGIEKNTMTPSGAQPLEYLIELAASSTYVKIDGNKLTNYSISAIKNVLGISGTLYLGSNACDDLENVIDTASYETSLTPNVYQGVGRLILIKQTLDMSVAAQGFAILTVPANRAFSPVTTTVRLDNDIAATNGEYWSVGTNNAGKRADWAMCDTAAADGKHLSNAKATQINTRIARFPAEPIVAAEVLQLLSIDAAIEAANLGNNIGGTAGDQATVFVVGWFLDACANV